MTRCLLPAIHSTVAQALAATLAWSASIGVAPAETAAPAPSRQWSSPDSLAPDPHPSDADATARAASIRTDPIDHGFTIVSGKMLDPPFVLEWKDGLLFINNLEVQPPQMGFDGGAPGAPGVPGGPSPQPDGGSTVAHIEQELRHDGLVIGFADGATRVFDFYMCKEILAILAADTPIDVKVESLAGLGIDHLGSWQWRTLLESLRLPKSFADRLTGIQSADRGFTAKPRPAAFANGTFAMLSFVLAVLALGFTIAHAPPNGEWRGQNPCPNAIRKVKMFIIVLIVLNTYDLIATLSMVQGGEITETNPLAALLLDSSRQVIFFKAALLLLGVTVLYKAREHRIAQLAVWWMVFAYTVLLIRWAAITSLLTMASVS